MQTGITITQFIRDQQRNRPDDAVTLGALITDLATACKAIADAVSQGELAGVLGNADSINTHGESQKKLDLIANALLLHHMGQSGLVAAMASEEMEDIHLPQKATPDSRYLLLFDPLDGSTNVEVNGVMGTIFSVLDGPERRAPTVVDFLQAGHRQRCAGYVLYGPSAMLVYSDGHGVHGFTLDRRIGEFILSHPDIRVPDSASEFAVNAAYARHWPAPIRRYVEDCLAGETGPLGRDFNMRWGGAMVVDAHRILTRGGVFLYSADQRPVNRQGKLRLLYEANPVAFLFEQAGGLATTGRERILDLQPRELHQRCPLILGSRVEVEQVLAEFAAGD